MAKHPHLRFFANRDTARAIQKRLNRRPNWHVFETGSDFEFRDLKVCSFSVPHDAYDPVGFVFQWGYGDLLSPRRSLAWVTDLGYVPTLVRERIRNADILVMEANYDDQMLERDPNRPWSVKQRIRGRHGHLSNQDALSFIQEMDSATWEHIYLVHLSRDCNDVSVVQDLFRPLLQSRRRLSMQVVDPHSGLAPAIQG
jgi:phosphoribosyl 1,2-cyclic phosphodiesterase